MERFFALRNEIALFMETKNKPVSLLADSTFQCNLAFLTDIMQHLNELNLKLQGKKQIITWTYDLVGRRLRYSMKVSTLEFLGSRPVRLV